MQFVLRQRWLLLLFLLGTATTACRQGPRVDLRQSQDVVWVFDGHNQWATPPSEDAWQPKANKTLDEKPISPEARAWFSYPLPTAAGLDYLLLTKCTNIVRVFQDQVLIIERTPAVSYPHHVRVIESEPFLTLPQANRPSRLILETIYADKTGYHPSCDGITVSNQEMALYQFLAHETTDLAAGAIVIFMSIGGFLLYAVKGKRLLLYFSLSACAMSLTYMTGTQLAFVLFAHKPIWRVSWHLLLAFSTIPFFLFIEQIMPTRLSMGRKLALINTAIFLLFAGLWLGDPSTNFDALRRSYYKILVLEALLYMPFILKAMFDKPRFGLGLGASLMVLIIAAVHDIGHLLFSDSSRIMLFPWALIGFIGLLLSIMIQRTIKNDAAIQRAKAKLIADRNRTLQAEVDLRTSDLNRRTSELERLHLELEDHHEILANQKKKVAVIARDKDVILSHIADLKNQSIPQIFSGLQRLHEAFELSTFHEIESQIQLLSRTLEPAAHQYEKSHSISKKRLLILDADRKHQRIYRMAIGGSKVDLQIAETPQEFLALNQKHPFDLLALHHSCINLIPEIMKTSPNARLVVMSSEETLKNLALMRHNPNVAHIIPLNLPRLMLQQILLIHLSKLLTRDIFGIEKYLGWGFEVKEKPLPSLDQKEFLVRELREDLEKMGLDAARMEAMAAITSCLLTLKKSQALVSSGSTNSISTPLQQLRYGFDASLVALSMDLRGQFLGQKDLIVLLEGQIQENEASRALPSLSQLLQLADALIINSDGDRRHEIIVLIFLEKNPGEHQPAAYFHFESRH